MRVFCFELIAEEISLKLSVDPAHVRLITTNEDQYRGKILSGKGASIPEVIKQTFNRGMHGTISRIWDLNLAVSYCADGTFLYERLPLHLGAKSSFSMLRKGLKPNRLEKLQTL